MKFFQTIQKSMAAMGFKPNQQQSNRRRFSSRQIFYTAKYSIDTISVGVYAFCGSDSDQSYMEMIFTLTALAGATVALVSLVFENDKLLNILDLIEIEADISNCNHFLFFYSIVRNVHFL